MNHLLKLLFSLLIALNYTTVTGQVTYTYPNPPFNVIFDGDLVEADYWDTIPRILSAGVGFSDIVAIDAPALDQNSVQQAGGAWLSDITCGVNDQDYTFTSLQNQVQML